jgi:formylmethanofuran dehydrogenase subunit E
MVKCANCDTYIPESESMTVDNRLICKHQPCKK